MNEIKNYNLPVRPVRRPEAVESTCPGDIRAVGTYARHVVAQTACRVPVTCQSWIWISRKHLLDNTLQSRGANRLRWWGSWQMHFLGPPIRSWTPANRFQTSVFGQNELFWGPPKPRLIDFKLVRFWQNEQFLGTPNPELNPRLIDFKHWFIFGQNSKNGSLRQNIGKQMGEARAYVRAEIPKNLWITPNRQTNYLFWCAHQRK